MKTKKTDISSLKPGSLRYVWRKLLKNKSAVFGLLVIALLMILSLLSPFICRYDYRSMDALRGLEDFDNVCVSLAMDCFDGYCSFDSYKLLEEISAEDCRLFVAESLAPERLALSVITPKEAKA